MADRIVAPRQWPGETVVCLGSGPSLTPADVDLCRGRARVIAVNDTFTLAPWADVLYACDASWWLSHPAANSFAGQKWSLDHHSWADYRARFPDVQHLANTGPSGLELDPSGLRNGRNSGYQAINLAVHFGASRIVLLGYDMQAPADRPAHFFGDHRAPRPPFNIFLPHFPTLVAPLQALGVELVNATRETALTCFSRAAITDVLQAVTV